MPIHLPENFPAIELLKKEHIFLDDSLYASSKDNRRIRLVVLNLMPLKITTESDIIRLLSNSPLRIEIDWMKIKGHISKNTPA
jgi:homoserine O-succinyltransferase